MQAFIELLRLKIKIVFFEAKNRNGKQTWYDVIDAKLGNDFSAGSSEQTKHFLFKFKQTVSLIKDDKLLLRNLLHYITNIDSLWCSITTRRFK